MATCGTHLGGYNCIQYGPDTILFLDICDKQGAILEYSISAKTTKPFAHKCPGANEQSILFNLGGHPALLHFAPDWSQHLLAVSHLKGDKWDRHEVEGSFFPGRTSIFTVDSKGHLYIVNDWPNEDKWFLVILALADGKYKEQKRFDLSFIKSDCGFTSLPQPRPTIAAIIELHGGEDLLLLYSGKSCRTIDEAHLDSVAILHGVHKGGDPHWDKFTLKGVLESGSPDMPPGSDQQIPNYSVFSPPQVHFHKGRIYVASTGHTCTLWALDLPKSIGGSGGHEWSWSSLGSCRMMILMDTGLSKASCVVEGGGAAKVFLVYKGKPEKDCRVESFPLP